ncbi:MAG: SBBP repeat-containing protein [Nitrospirota bacterium]
MRTKIWLVVLLALATLSLVVVSCGGGGVNAVSWTGTKQMGVAGKNTIANGIAVDASGNVYVAGYTNGGLDNNALTGSFDFFITKFNALGNKVYTKQTGTSGKTTMASGLAVDLDGNVYAAGYTDGGLDGNVLTGTSDFFVSKYGPSGNLLSTIQTGTTGKSAGAQGIAVDPIGNVYVTGYTYGGLAGNPLVGVSDYFLFKYGPAWNLLYSKQTGSAGKYSEGYGVAVDSNNNAYVAGRTTGGLGSNTLVGTYDLFLAKHDSSGAALSTYETGSTGLYSSAVGVAVDAGDNVYIAGVTNAGLDNNTLTGTSDFILIKINAAGNKVYTRQMGAAGTDTKSSGIAVDSNGYVYITGYTLGGLDGHALTGTRDYFLVKYDPDGNRIWTRQSGVTGKLAEATGVAVDANNNVYVAGYTDGGLDGNVLAGTYDFFIAKYDSDGNKK